MKHNQIETETDFANQLRNEILRCGNIFDEGKSDSDVLSSCYEESVRPLVHHAVSRNPNISFLTIKRETKSVGGSQRAGRHCMNSPTKRSPALPLEVQEVPNWASKPLSGIFAIEQTREVSTPSSHLGRMPQINSMTTSMTSREPSRPPRSCSRFPSRNYTVFACFVCFREGHFLMECPLLSPKQRSSLERLSKGSKQPGCWERKPSERLRLCGIRL